MAGQENLIYCPGCGQAAIGDEETYCPGCKAKRFGGEQQHETMRLFEPAPAVMRGSLTLDIDNAT